MSDDPRSTSDGHPEPTITTEPAELTTGDGERLEAQWAIPATDGTNRPRAAVVACHPHPLRGGSMHANVVEALFRALPADGAAVLRFNFRGTGASTGRHDDGRAERLDVAAAIDTVTARWADVPVVLAGYSFGADVSLAVDDPALIGWFAVAPPLRLVERSAMVALTDPRPTVLAAGVHDQFNPAPALTETVADATATTVVAIDGADHFFAVGLGDVVEAARGCLPSA